MSNFLLIDSTEGSLLALKGNQNVIATEDKELKVIAEEATAKISNDTIIVINAEARIKGETLQDSKAIELIYWFRCKYNLKNPIVIFSVFSLSHQLRRNPNHFVLVSPGCYFFEEIPVLNDSYKPKPLSALEDIKPFLKPKIDELLGTFRHRYANYSGMAMMLEAAGIKPETFEPLQSYTRFTEFVDYLDYAILTTYFGRNTHVSSKKGLNSKKRILLVDDLAQEGWLAILGQLIYNDAKSNKLDYVNNDGTWDEEQTQRDLDDKIKSHRPHLLLLDLRLGDEQGNKAVVELGGYKLLTYLKNHHVYKGVPVIMFTATTQADTVKALLQADATAVWTKPGIDEGLSQKEVIERYEQLLTLIESTFNKFEQLDLGLNDKTTSNSSFEVSRTDFLKKLDWVKYRVELLPQNGIQTNFDGYTDIIIDTNFFISGDDSQSHLDFEKTFTNIFLLTQIIKNSKTKHNFTVINNPSVKQNNLSVKQNYPKIVVLNSIFDEILNFAKTYDGKVPNKWKRSLLSFDVIRTLFDEQLVRTEMVYLDKNQIPRSGLNSLNDTEMASHLLNVSQGSKIDPDDLIVAEVDLIVNGTVFKVKKKDKNGQKYKIDIKFTSAAPQVLILTNEDPNETNDPTKIPEKIRSIISDKSKFEILNIKKFNQKMSSILSQL